MTSEERRFWKDVYLAVLPTISNPSAGQWEIDGKYATGTSDYARVAADAANRAVYQLRKARP